MEGSEEESKSSSSFNTLNSVSSDSDESKLMVWRGPVAEEVAVGESKGICELRAFGWCSIETEVTDEEDEGVGGSGARCEVGVSGAKMGLKIRLRLRTDVAEEDLVRFIGEEAAELTALVGERDSMSAAVSNLSDGFEVELELSFWEDIGLFPDDPFILSPCFFLFYEA